MSLFFMSLPASLLAKDSFLAQRVYSHQRSRIYSFFRGKGSRTDDLRSSRFLGVDGRYLGIAIASIGVMGLGSCSSNAETASSTVATDAATEKLQIVTTFVPITEFDSSQGIQPSFNPELRKHNHPKNGQKTN